VVGVDVFVGEDQVVIKSAAKADITADKLVAVEHVVGGAQGFDDQFHATASVKRWLKACACSRLTPDSV
jgi:hypothetical protein